MSTPTTSRPSISADRLSFRLTPAAHLGWIEHYLEIDLDGVGVGGMTWRPGDGRINQITILADHRRQGLATALYAQAQTLPSPITRPVRGKGRSLTADGRAWNAALDARQGPAPA